MSEPDLGAIISAAQSYGDAREALGKSEAEAAAQVKLDALQAEFDAYRASHPDQPKPEPVHKTIIGMSAPAGEWSRRVSEVGAAGLGARRIFADLTSAGSDQGDLIKQTHVDGLMPVVSFKVPSVASAISGSYDAWAVATARFLASFRKPTAVTIWHEPRNDMTAAQYVALQQRLVPIFKANADSVLKVGPLLNGFLLDRPAGRTEFATFTSPKLMQTWDWFGVDTYHPDATSTTHAGMRIPPLVEFVAAQGRPGMPLGVGEYSGYTADALAKAGETFLSTPSLWFACVWNSQEGKVDLRLAGDRLAAFQATKADARAQR